MVNVYIGLGSNLGNKEENIKRAINLLKEKCKVLKISKIYKTEPLYYKNQDWFLNCAIEVETNLMPKQLLNFCQLIGKKLKRIRTIRYGPRTIDLDILFYDKKIINEKNLVVPHPKLHDRSFVLVPLNDICPDFVHPVLKKSIRELISDLNYSDLIPLNISQ